MKTLPFHTGKVQLSYATTGIGKRPIVLLHGTTDRWQHFEPVIPRLAQHFQLYALDLRGHGRSGHVPMGYRVVDFAEDIGLFLEKVVGETAVLIGHSLGGLIGIHVAANAPSLVKALIIEDSPLFLRRATVKEGSPRAYNFFHALYNGLQTTQSDTELSAYLRQHLPPERQQNLPDMVSRLQQVDPDVIKMSYNSMLMDQFDIDACLRQIQCPTLLLQANPQTGGALLDEDATAVLTQLSNGHHRFVPHSGHAIHVDQPQLFVDEVKSFLETAVSKKI